MFNLLMKKWNWWFQMFTNFFPPFWVHFTNFPISRTLIPVCKLTRSWKTRRNANQRIDVRNWPWNVADGFFFETPSTPTAALPKGKTHLINQPSIFQLRKCSFQGSAIQLIRMLLEPTKTPLRQKDFHSPKDPWDWYIYLLIYHTNQPFM